MLNVASRATGLPAVLGGSQAFPAGLPLTQVRVADRVALRRRLGGVLDSGQLTNGRLVSELEEIVAARLAVPHVVAVASCTSGLALTLQALGMSGRPVLMPGFTFAATAHAAVWAGGSPRFADISRDSLTLDPDDAAARVPGCAAMMATHVYGTPCATESLARVAADEGIPLIYDAAHALGSQRGGVPIGGFGTAEVFSLSPTKVAFGGEGGLIATTDPELARHCRLGRDYGNPGDYDCQFPGLNARMSELHAALALDSVAVLDERVARRGELVRRFQSRLGGVPGLVVPLVDAADVSTYKDLTLLVDEAVFGIDVPSLARALHAEGVDSRRYFFPPVHRQRAYADLPDLPDLPVTDYVAPRVLTLPLWSHMTDDQIDRLAETIVRIHTSATLVRKALA